MSLYPRLSGPYFVAVEQMKTNYGGKDYSGNAVDLQKIREEGNDNTYLKHIHLMTDRLSSRREIK